MAQTDARRRAAAPRFVLPGRVVVPGLAGVAALAVLGHDLGRLPLWRDEVASVAIAERPVGAILAAAGRIDVVHTAYYLLLHVVVRVGGDGEAWVRLPSLIAAAAVVVLTVGLAHRLLGAAPALLAAALLLGNPWFGFYAREARPYALGVALVCGAAWVLLAGPPTPRRLVAFTALSVAATWVHLFDALPLLGMATAQARTAVRSRRGPATGVGVACWAGAVIVVAPLVVLARREAGQVSWVARPTAEAVRQLLGDVAGTPAAGGAVGALLLVGMGVVVRQRRSAPVPGRRVGGEGGDGAARGGRAGGLAVAALAGALAGPVVLLAASVVGPPLYVERYVLASVPLLAMAAAAAARLLLDAAAARAPASPGVPAVRPVSAGHRRLAAAAALALVVLAALTGVPAAYAGPADKTEDLRAGAAYLAAAQRPGDCVAYDPGWARVGVEHYLARTPARPRDVALDAARPTVGLFPDELPTAAVAANLRACPRVWVVGYPGPVGRWRPVPEVTGAALAVTAAGFEAAAPAAFGDLVVTLLTARRPVP